VEGNDTTHYGLDIQVLGVSRESDGKIKGAKCKNDEVKEEVKKKPRGL